MPLLLLALGIVLIVGALRDNVAGVAAALEEDILPPHGVLSTLALLTVIWLGSRLLRLPMAGHALSVLILATMVLADPAALGEARKELEGATAPAAPSPISTGVAGTVGGTEAEPKTAGSAPTPAGSAPTPAAGGSSSNGIPFGGLLGGFFGGGK